MKAIISERALLARINRKLAPDYQAIRKCREDARGFDFLGHYYHVDLYKNAVQDTHCNLETMGRKLGVFKPFEKLER